MPETVFKPGDRVRVVGYEEPHLHDEEDIPIGTECVVNGIGRIGDGWLPGHYHLVELIERPPEPLVYDAPTPEQLPDAITRPHHYARFTIEPITFINANGLPYNIGNVIKYACRYDAKNGVEDLKKARRYLDIHIETLDRQARVAAGEAAADVWKETL